MFLYEYMPHACRCPQGSEEDIEFPGAGDASICELLNVGAGVAAQDLLKSSKHLWPLSHLFSLIIQYILKNGPSIMHMSSFFAHSQMRKDILDLVSTQRCCVWAVYWLSSLLGYWLTCFSGNWFGTQTNGHDIYFEDQFVFLYELRSYFVPKVWQLYILNQWGSHCHWGCPLHSCAMSFLPGIHNMM